ncbi:MAG: hypothetical protein J5589_06525 [Firmicutes bacterium]|nr:hypothetical protein [Bacillota bacterium]
MFVLFYRNYTYAPSCTLLSALGSMLAFLAAIGGIVCIVMVKEKPVMAVVGVLLLIAAFCSWWFLGRKLPDKLSPKISEKNISTKPGFAAMYCREHPEAYASLCQKNPDFAAKYTFNEKGKLVKRK